MNPTGLTAGFHPAPQQGLAPLHPTLDSVELKIFKGLASLARNTRSVQRDGGPRGQRPLENGGT